MVSHSTSSVQETVDRLAIGELIDAYAHCADRRDARGQMNLFTDDARFVVYMVAGVDQPAQELRGREALAWVVDELDTYAASFHFTGQRAVSVEGDRATGQSYCLAHYLSVSSDGQRTMMVAAIRYLDAFVNRTARGCLPSVD
jgi:ketosteroid isomerase-like protein